MRLNRKRTRSRVIRVITTGALMLCLVAGSVPLTGSAYAASNFTSETPFSGTTYGNGTGDKTYTHDGKFSGNLIVNGVDVSWWQGDSSNWTKAKKDGVDFAILRVSYTSLSSSFKTYTDSHFSSHYKKCRNAGVDLIGVYAYSQAKTENEAAAEARFAVKRLKALGIGPDELEMPVYMDYEFGGGRLSPTISKSKATKCAKAFCEVIRNAGYKPGIYANTNFFRYYLNTSSLASDIDLWCAQYYYKNTLSPVYSKWQYSSTAHIDGIISTTSGKIGGTDVDFWYIDKTKNSSSSYKIYGNTYVKYTGDPVKPSFDVYYGSKLLKEGKDYIVTGINNIGSSSGKIDAHAYILGIGKYSGYAVVPFKIKSSYKAHVGLDNKACEDADGIILSNKHIIEEITKYLVRFVDEDGKDLIDPAYYQSGTSGADVDVPAPKKEGFIFSGWIGEDGNIIDPNSVNVNGPSVYTAAFEPEPEPVESEEEITGDTPDGEADDGAADTEETEADAADEEAVSEEEADGDETSDAEPGGEADEPESVNESEDLPAEITEQIDTGRTYLDLNIGYNSNNSYVRNIPAGTTAASLVDAIEIRKGYKNYSLKVLTASFKNRTGTLKTGDVLCVYKEDDLVGTADITVNGSTINDTGAVHLKKATASKVTIARTSIKNLKKYRKAFKVTVAQKSTAYASGYQVKYSLKSNMSKSVTKTISKSASTVTKKIKGLKSKKIYYVQVRTFKTVNGKTYYSSWSAKRKVKTK